jgi:DNA-binding MarR family transcriptional regulator
MPRRTRFDYTTLAEFRYHIRKFLRFSEEAALAAGLNGAQHQLLLAVKGLPPSLVPTVGTLAERLQLRHHSVVELVDRLAERGCVRRAGSPSDRRQVLVAITARGESLLRRLTTAHRAELQKAAPALIEALGGLTS